MSRSGGCAASLLSTWLARTRFSFMVDLLGLVVGLWVDAVRGKGTQFTARPPQNGRPSEPVQQPRPLTSFVIPRRPAVGFVARRDGDVGAERRITNLADAVNATDAVNLGQLDAVEALLQGQIDTNTADIVTLQTDVSTLQTNVTTLQTGQPFTVRLGFNRSGNLNTTGFSMNERPDLKSGYPDNPILGGPDRYWDINAFALPAAGTRGNLGRNTLTGPGLINADVSLIKAFKVQAERTLQVRIEVFNFLNRANFAVPSGRIAFTNAAGDVAPNWGRITSTVTTARQIQLGVKFLF